jgi:hypothetical protein
MSSCVRLVQLFSAGHAWTGGLVVGFRVDVGGLALMSLVSRCGVRAPPERGFTELQEVGYLADNLHYVNLTKF